MLYGEHPIFYFKEVFMTIRHSQIEEINRIMETYDFARKLMIANGNVSQWIDGYPSEELIRNDIYNKNSFIIEDKGKILGVFTFIIGDEPTYSKIEGKWINDDIYGTIHRIAGAETGNKIFDLCLKYCFNIISNIRIDTHEDNKIMRRLLEKNGFIRCGIIYVSNGTPRIAYQKTA